MSCFPQPPKNNNIFKTLRDTAIRRRTVLKPSHKKAPSRSGTRFDAEDSAGTVTSTIGEPGTLMNAAAVAFDCRTRHLPSCFRTARRTVDKISR
jgi:hypothetical protein